MDDKTPEQRAAESPTRTIESVDSTAVSVDTIVDRNNSNTEIVLQNQTVTMANSTNTTNNQNKNSLTNSQISMISNDQKDSHIYTSPDLIATEKKEKDNIVTNDQVVKSTETIRKEIAKPIKVAEQISEKLGIEKKHPPLHIVLGVVQLVLSVSLAALGGLLLARDASLASTGSGLWAGAIAAIAGSLGVINVPKARTGFLAVSLVCVASSTLAMALTGIGLVRDVNRLEQNEEIETTKGAISAGSGLIFALVLHFAVSIFSVYQSALKLCSRNPEKMQMLDNVISVNNASLISQQKVEEYIKSLAYEQQQKLFNQHSGHGKSFSTEDCDKLMAMWMNSTLKRSSKGSLPPSPPRQIMLVPASAGNRLPPIPQMLPPGYCPMPMLFPPGMLPPGAAIGPQKGIPIPYASLPIPPLPPGSSIHPQDLKTLYRIHSPRTASETTSRRPRPSRTSKSEASRRQRRKSESDAENRKAFTYTGLDRAIADSFLERQEISNHSHAECSSGTSAQDDCRDVAM